MAQEVPERGASLGVQWLGLHAFTTRGQSLIPGRGTTIPQATQCGKKEALANKQITTTKNKAWIRLSRT